MATKRTTEPKINAALLKTMQGIYAEYTGQEIADVIGYIRDCIEREQELALVEQEIDRLTLLREELSSKC
jgi:hypothetical protein